MKKILLLIMLLIPFNVVAMSASSMVAVDLDNDYVYFDANKDDKRLIASITKIMTTIVTIENIDIDKEGKDILIGFNPRFLIDALKVIDDETISIYLVNPKAPCFIRDDEENYTYLILPVNINQNQAR